MHFTMESWNWKKQDLIPLPKGVFDLLKPCKRYCKRPCNDLVNDLVGDHVTRRTEVRSPMSSACKKRSVLLAKYADVSRRIVSRHLFNDFNLNPVNLRKKSILTAAPKTKSLLFAMKHAKWIIRQWQRVFSRTNLP